MIPDTGSATTIDDKPTNALARWLRAHLRALAALRVPITYRDVAKAMRLSPPHIIHRVTEALEQLKAEDAAADCPFIAAMVVSKWRSGLPAPGFSDYAARLGRFAGDATGPNARAFLCRRVQRVDRSVGASMLDGGDDVKGPRPRVVIVGGGPTGVEMAGSVIELAREALAADFRTIGPQQTHVLLVEAGPRLLPSFPESLSRHAEQALRRLSVDVRVKQAVTHCAAIGVTLGDEHVDAATVIWAAGSPPHRRPPGSPWQAVALAVWRSDRICSRPVRTTFMSSATRRSPMTLPVRHSPASPRSPKSRASTWPQPSRRTSAARARRQPPTFGTKACSRRLAARPPSSRSDAFGFRDGLRGGSGALPTCTSWSAYTTG